MKKALLFVLLGLGVVTPAHAQQQSQALVVTSCGAQSLAAATFGFLTMDTTGKLCDGASGGSVTVVSSGKANAAAPTLIEGTNNPISTDLSANQRVIDAAVLAAVQAPIPAGTNVIGKVDIPSGGVVAGAYASGAVPDIAAAGLTDAAACTSGTSVLACLRQMDADVKAAIPAGTNIIGNVRVDQTTPGTTNGVAIAPSAAAGVGISAVVSGSAEASHVLKGSGGNLYGAYATNLTATAGFLAILNSTTAPGDGAITPLACVPLPGNSSAYISRGAGPPQVYSTGITAVVTSAATCFTKTTGVITAFISGDVQ